MVQLTRLTPRARRTEAQARSCRACHKHSPDCDLGFFHPASTTQFIVHSAVFSLMWCTHYVRASVVFLSSSSSSSFFVLLPATDVVLECM